MSGVRTSSRHHDRPASARHHGRSDDYARSAEEPQTRSSTQRHRSSSRNSPRHRRDPALQETHRFRPEDYVLEDGVPPLRRQSTQPPNRKSSPPRSSLAPHRDGEASAFRRREVEPTSAGRRTPSRPSRSSRHGTPVDPALSTALVVVQDKQVSPHRHASHRRERPSPRRSHHDSRVESEDGVVRSPRQHVSPTAAATTASPRRAHRQAASPIRPERRTQSSQRHRHASAEPRGRSSHGSARRHRDSPSSRAAPAPEATLRQDTLRYRSPPLVAEEKHRSASRRSRRHSRGDAQEEPATKRSPSRRHDSARRSRSERPSERHDSARRHRHERRPSVDVATAHSRDEGRRSRHSSRHRQASQDSSVAPRPPQLAKPLESDRHATAPYAGGSTYVRPAGNAGMNARRSSGSYIEVISVSSARPGSSNGWPHSRNSAPQSPRRPREVGPPVVIPDPRGEKIMQRIDSTRHWIRSMKEEVERDRVREQQQQQEQEKRAAEEAAAQRRRESEVARQERQRAKERNGSARRQRSSHDGSTRRTREHREAAATSALPEPVKPLESRRQPHAAIAPAAAPETPLRGPSAGSTRSQPLSRHSEPTPLARSDKAEGSRRSAKPASPPPPPAAAVLHDTLNSSRKEGFDYPIFSFISFLDGNTFDSTAGLCEYNSQLAESLSDEHLDLLREVLFSHDEDAFAELLYGDDVQAELDVIAKTLSHSEDPAVQREIVVLQRAAVRRFNEKCAAALRTLLAARGGLADAVQLAASKLERQAFEAKAAAANSP